MVPKLGSLCTGYGGLDQAVTEAIGPTQLVWVADVKPAAQYLLSHRHPGVPNLGDVRDVDWSWVEPIEILAASWPCQPHAAAGRRLGSDDPRDLWPEVHRAIRELRPRLFFGENVSRIVANGELHRVCTSLTEIGYLVAWHTNTASSVGAPHRRERTWVIATDTRGEAS